MTIEQKTIGILPYWEVSWNYHKWVFLNGDDAMGFINYWKL